MWRGREVQESFKAIKVAEPLLQIKPNTRNPKYSAKTQFRQSSARCILLSSRHLKRQGEKHLFWGRSWIFSVTQRKHLHIKWTQVTISSSHWLISLPLAPLKHRSTSTRIHGVTFDKAVIFLLAAVRTWSLTSYIRADACDQKFETKKKKSGRYKSIQHR